MSIALDGFKVLRRLGESPEAFTAIRADVDKAARALVVKCLKATSTGLDTIRAVHKAIGGKQFELVLEGLKDAEVTSVLTRIDKHYPEMKTQSSKWRRQHLCALASGKTDPASPDAKAAKAKAPDKSARLQSDVMDLFRARGKTNDN